MIGLRGNPPSQHDEQAGLPPGFDDPDIRLGDLMRGERATLGKSLLDVQRELRIRASYVAAIENCDISAFDAPSFVAGSCVAGCMAGAFRPGSIEAIGPSRAIRTGTSSACGR